MQTRMPINGMRIPRHIKGTGMPTHMKQVNLHMDQHVNHHFSHTCTHHPRKHQCVSTQAMGQERKQHERRQRTTPDRCLMLGWQKWTARRREARVLESALRVLHMQSHLTLKHYIQSLHLNNYHTLLPKEQ